MTGLAPALGGEPAIDYVHAVKPILTKRCVACHGPLTAKAGLRLDTAARLKKGGDSGPAVVPGDPEDSPLLDAVTGEGGWRMPPEGEGEALSAADVATLKAWVAAGANSPGVEADAPDPRAHWSFRPPVRPPVPPAKNAAWARNPVDAFLATGHEAHGLSPIPPADRPTLLRRVALDLTGLAPSPAELRAFLDDPADDAYERAVDRMLASPSYGERWGRHWMDVWRYSDWDGFGAEVRESQPHVWRWRDWIVESLNADAGYDRMVVAMLAADEAAPGDESQARATGYLARSWYKFSRNVWLDNVVEHTSKAFLGLTLNCARCHDHKYDPLAQKDYYRFRAFFEPHDVRADAVPGQPLSGVARVYDAKPETPTYLFIRGDDKDPDKARPLAPGIPPVLGRNGVGPIAAVPLPRESFLPGLRPFVAAELVEKARKDLTAAEASKKAAAKGSPAEKPAEASVNAARAALTASEARVAADRAKAETPSRPDADLLARLAALAERRSSLLAAEVTRLKASTADVDAQAALKAKPADAAAKTAATAATKALDAASKASDVARAALAKDDGGYTPLGPTYPAISTGRRLALARWATSRQNPLAARVAVNHIWARHFGAALVPSVADFGLNGKPPTHPELLDWLAVEFMESGWSMKALHRRLVTTEAYRMRSTPDDSVSASNQSDPSNVYLWRMNPRRMEAEAVRDNVLAASGRLSPAMGGPDLDPETAQTDGRRSLYFRHAKEKRATFLRLFDSPSVVACYRRSESVVPQQALALANSTLVRENARTLAKVLGTAAPDDSSFVSSAFERLLGRLPTPAERAECLAYLGASADATKGRAGLVHVLFSHNDFVTIR